MTLSRLFHWFLLNTSLGGPLSLSGLCLSTLSHLGTLQHFHGTLSCTPRSLSGGALLHRHLSLSHFPTHTGLPHTHALSLSHGLSDLGFRLLHACCLSVRATALLSLSFTRLNCHSQAWIIRCLYLMDFAHLMHWNTHYPHHTSLSLSSLTSHVSRLYGLHATPHLHTQDWCLAHIFAYLRHRHFSLTFGSLSISLLVPVCLLHLILILFCMSHSFSTSVCLYVACIQEAGYFSSQPVLHTLSLFMPLFFFLSLPLTSRISLSSLHVCTQHTLYFALSHLPLWVPGAPLSLPFRCGLLLHCLLSLSLAYCILSPHSSLPLCLFTFCTLFSMHTSHFCTSLALSSSHLFSLSISLLRCCMHNLCLSW